MSKPSITFQLIAILTLSMFGSFGSTTAHAGLVLINDDFSSSGSLITGDFNRVRTRYAINPGQPGVWVRGAGNWSLSNGALQNTASTSDPTGEAGVGMVVDVSTITSTTIDSLSLSFDYELGDPAESLYLHMWGVVQQPGTLNETGTGQSANDMLAHVGFRQNGSFEDFSWQTSNPALSDVLDVHNLLGPTTVGRPDIRPQDAIEFTGTTGPQTYSTTIDLSTLPNSSLGDYDFFLVGFSRNVAGPSSSISIDSFNLVATPEPSSAVLFSFALIPVLRRKRKPLGT